MSTTTPRRTAYPADPVRIEKPKPDVGDVLERAAYFFEEGILEWGECAYVCPSGARCMWGAIALAYEEFGLPVEPRASVIGTAEDFIPGSLLEGPGWNDVDGRTKAEVIAALRGAAAAARGETA